LKELCGLVSVGLKEKVKKQKQKENEEEIPSLKELMEVVEEPRKVSEAVRRQVMSVIDPGKDVSEDGSFVPYERRDEWGRKVVMVMDREVWEKREDEEEQIDWWERGESEERRFVGGGTEHEEDLASHEVWTFK
jgi:hypothetical protein